MYVLYINSVESTHTVDGKSMGEIKEKKYKNVRKINYYSFFSWLLKQFGFNSSFCKHQNTTRVGKLVFKKNILLRGFQNLPAALTIHGSQFR